MSLRFRIKKHEWHIAHTALGMVVFQFLNFGAGVLIARGLGAAGQGRYQLLVAVVVVVVGVARLGLDEGLTYIIPKYKEQQKGKVQHVVRYVLVLCLGIAIGLCSTISIFSSKINNILFQLEGFEYDLKFAVLIAPPLMLLMMGMAVLRGCGRSDLRAGVYYYGVGISFFLMAGVLYLYGMNNAGVYILRSFSYILGAAIAIWLVYRILPVGEGRLTLSDIRDAHLFSAMLILVSLFQYLVEQPLIDLTIVSRISSPSQVGIYSVAAKVASLVGLLCKAFIIALAPIISEGAAKNDWANVQSNYNRSSTILFRSTLLIGGCAYLLRYQLLRLFGPEYMAGEQILLICLAGHMVAGMSGVNTPLLLSGGYARVELFMTICGAGAMIGGGIVLGRIFGPTGVALATAATWGLLSISRRACTAYLFRIKLAGSSFLILMAFLLCMIPSLIIEKSIGLKSFLPAVFAVTIFICLYLTSNLLFRIRPGTT